MSQDFLPVDQQLAILKRGAVDLVDETQFEDKLARSRKLGKPLTVKIGFDATAPDLHLGHCVLLTKMRQFQDLGHRVIFLMGDFTAMIGDPTGKKATRPQLTREEVTANLATYERQGFKILDDSKTIVDYNSKWLDALGSSGLIKLAGKYTLARMMERDDFRTRYENNESISLHELLYPLAQGYDSVALEADVELGGHDQIFNLLVGRTLMKEHGLEPQCVLTVPLLVGTDGTDKMSKSLGNAIGVEDPAKDIYGRTMSIPDDLMWDWMLLLTDIDESGIEAKKRQVADGSIHPKAVKQELAHWLTSRFAGAQEADQAAAEFENVFSGGGVPDDIDTVSVDASLTLIKVLTSANMAASNSEARRLIEQGAVSLDGEKSREPFGKLTAREEPYLLKVGKRRFANLLVQSENA